MISHGPSRTLLAVFAAIALNSAVIAALCLPQTMPREPRPPEPVLIRLVDPPPPPTFPDPSTPPEFVETPTPSPAKKPRLATANARLTPDFARSPAPETRDATPKLIRKTPAPPRPVTIAPPKLAPPAIATSAVLPNHPPPPPKPSSKPTVVDTRELISSLLENPPAGDTIDHAAAPPLPAPTPEPANDPVGVVNLGQQMPTPLHRVNPDYPAAALRLGLEGYVDVRFVISPDGSVANVSIADSSSSRFHAATIAAIKQWRFEPVIRDGKNVMAFCTKRFSFQQR